MVGVDLSPMQQATVDSITAWYEYDGADQVYRLFGFAGSGKTTLARHIVDQLGVANVRYAAYTGKAVSVLRSKGAAPASTIHSLIYIPRAQAMSKLRDLRRELVKVQGYGSAPMYLDKIRELEAAIQAEEKRLTSPTFLPREPAESALTGTDLLVVDEVSMVDEPTARDLLAYGIPTLVLGDPAQLPPVRGEGWFTSASPDSLLTEVHRHALDSPVTRVATTIRTAGIGTRGYGVTEPDGDSGRWPSLPPATLASADQVLCGTNRTRWRALRTIRRMAGLRGSAPANGDKIIILSNNPTADVYNGQMFMVKWASSARGQTLDLVVTGEDGEGARDLTVWRSGFDGPEGERRAKLQGWRGDVVAATFGQAITVHKAQGSQWPRVLVIDESSVFGREGGTAGYEAGRRWLYTATTRASEAVILTGDTILH